MGEAHMARQQAQFETLFFLNVRLKLQETLRLCR